VTQNQNQIIVAICDGVSSASKAEIASKLVAAQVGEVISKVFKGRVTLDNELWIEVNRELSATLVRRYISDLDEASIALPSKSSELRLQTSEIYATTLEILVIEKESEEKCKRGYLYVKVAGDGSLFKLRKRSFFQAGSIEEISGENSGNLVNALPVFDGQVEVEEGSLKRGESLVAATDGFSSALLNSDELRTFMIKNAWRNFGIKHVSKALRIASRYSRDDLTLTKVDLA
jgi:serine/threonine protein phosphatase PrpC